MDREHTCCFTGHRPERLPWGDDENDSRCLAMKDRLDEALLRAYEEGYRHFVCGMARGADLYFCEAVLALRQAHGDVTLEAAIPYQAQADRAYQQASRQFCPWLLWLRISVKTRSPAGHARPSRGADNFV